MPKITIPKTPSILDQILALPVDSVVGVRGSRNRGENTFSDVLLRTGESGWLTARPHNLSGRLATGGGYLTPEGVEAWVANLGDGVDFYHLTGE